MTGGSILNIHDFLVLHGSDGAFWPWGWDFPPIAPWFPVLYPELAEQLRPQPPPLDRTADARELLENYGVCENSFWPQGWDYPPMATWLEHADPELAERLRPAPHPRTWTFQRMTGTLRLIAQAPPRPSILTDDAVPCTCTDSIPRKRLETTREFPALTLAWEDRFGEVVQQSSVPYQTRHRLLHNGLASWLTDHEQAVLQDIEATLDQWWQTSTTHPLSVSTSALVCDAARSCRTASVAEDNKQDTIDGEDCCRWDVDHIETTYYVSKAYGDPAVDGSSPSAPTTLDAGLGHEPGQFHMRCLC